MLYALSGRSCVSVILTALWLLSSVNGVAAKAVCHTDAQGNEQCKQMLSTGVIVAIVVSIVVFFGICLGVWFYIRRTRARKEAQAIEATFTVEPAQIRGPPVMIRNTATATTTYGSPRMSASFTNGFSGTGYYSSGTTGSTTTTTIPAKTLAAAMKSTGSAPALPPLNLGGSGAGPSSAPSNKPTYPFTGISSSRLPPMPQPASAYVRTGPAFGYGYV